MMSVNKYPFEVQAADSGCTFVAGFFFYGRAFRWYRQAIAKGYTRVKLIRKRDNKVLFGHGAGL